MTPRTKWAAGGVVLAVAAGLAVVAWVAVRPDPDLAAFGQVREGMVYEEVVGLIGRPPDYEAQPYRVGWDAAARVTTIANWEAGDGTVLSIWVNDRGIVVYTAIRAADNMPTFFARLRARLGL